MNMDMISAAESAITERSRTRPDTTDARRGDRWRAHRAGIVYLSQVGVLALAALSSAQPSLETLDGTVYGGSRDGAVGVGAYDYPSSGLHATRWSWSAPGITGQNLGFLVVGGSQWRHSDGYSANADGSVVFGWSGDCNCNHGHAFRWTAATGMVDLGTLPGDAQSAAGYCSDNGNVAIGWSQATGCFKAVVWHAGQGFTSLGTMDQASCGSVCSGISADGAVIAGNDLNGAGNGLNSWLWSSGTGFRPVGSGTPCYSYNLSGDGNVAVGIAAPANPFRWSASFGMQDLGRLPGASDGYAYAVNNDGTAVAGDCNVNGVRRAFLWTSALGMVDLTAYLQSAGVDTHGRVLSTVYSMSGDGSVVWGVLYGGGAYRVSGLPCIPYIQHGPTSTIVCPAHVATFATTATGVGPLTYQWQWQPETSAAWTDLTNGINSYLGQPALDVTGATESTLRPRVLWGLGGNLPFRCIVSNACGSVTSNAATLTICAADFNCDASVDFFDYLDFVDAFTSSATSADFNGDGFIDFFDYLDFVDAFATGCGA